MRSLALALVLASAAAAEGAPRRYRIDPAASTVRIDVGRAGLLSFAGHEHVIEATRFAGAVTVDESDPGSSSVEVTFDAAGLVVRGEKEPPGDAPKVEAAMRGEKLLEVARFPAITFRSRGVTARPAGPGKWALEVAGDLTVHGVTRAVTLPMAAALQDGALSVEGRTTLRHDWFGLKPISVAGVVKVKNEIAVAYGFVARASD
jgi:polyisoprenoid-binding protein YceI